ncbi:2Fe-2S iron-sulfur cluster-binding protein [Pseudonocardia sp. GCM10023141]|uniref:2Fe-2S iron-sulfur cluster-binding protein n=1 Tax=Pseudonocardia sp. GCM10023141 TaxID=3252653 RepID=UPI00361650EC
MITALPEPPPVAVRIEPLGIELAVLPGESLMAAARRHGFWWPTRCRGQALCTACLCEVVSGADRFEAIGRLEREALESLREFRDRRPGELRLGCQARPTGRATVHKRGVRPAGEARRPTALPS